MVDQLTEEQIKSFKQAFTKYDKDGGQTISTNELQDVMHDLGCHLTGAELQDMINVVDSDANGEIDFPEFLSLLATKKIEHQAEEDLAEAFNLFDQEKTGKINANQLIKVINQMGQNMTQEEGDAFIEEADLDKDGSINFEEFFRIMNSK